jgi:serine/threonine-protein kinase
MGEVWRATDTKLGRDVAIKLLPETFAGDADRMARFQREAQVLASLNHPNIAAIYGVEDRALVLELVEGPTLADRVAHGPIPIEDVIPIAKQIAEALEYAHEKGIVHRDLKPANIKLAPDGRVKVLDFGLARALTADIAFASDPMSSPTITMRSGIGGLILGTAGYMSPEQAKGKPADRRADIWAFGVVLAEMLTGRMMYTGETVSETLASVIKDQPDLGRLPPATPSNVRRLLKRCLDKDPRRRLQSMGEARIALEEPEEAAVAPSALVPERRNARLWQAITGLLGVALLATLALLWQATRPTAQPMMRLSVDLGPGAVPGERISAALSPDGSRIVYPVRSASGLQLATRLLDQSNSTVIAGSEGGTDPFFSPDGQWVGFFADGKMKKTPLLGGTPITLAEVDAGPRGAAWGEDGNIIANLDLRHLWSVPASGGKRELLPLNAEANGYTGYRWPQILPGGDTLLVTASSTVGAYDDADIAAVSLTSGKVKVIARGAGYGARALPTGHMVYVHQGVLMAVRFDSRRLEAYGTPQLMVEGVAGNPTIGAGEFDVSSTGTLVYLNGGQGSNTHDVVWMDASGKQVRVLPSAAAALTPRLSPDGARLALSENGDVSVYDLARGTLAQITFTHSSNQYPIWTPDGKHIVYTSTAKEIWWTRADGSAQPERLVQSNLIGVAATSFSPDGKRMAYRQFSAGADQGIWILPLDLSDPDHPKPGQPELFARSSGMETEPAFSPDGHWVAYTSTESGILQVLCSAISARSRRWRQMADLDRGGPQPVSDLVTEWP